MRKNINPLEESVTEVVMDHYQYQVLMNKLNTLQQKERIILKLKEEGQNLLNELTKQTDLGNQLKTSIKDISLSTLKLNKNHLMKYQELRKQSRKTFEEKNITISNLQKELQYANNLIKIDFETYKVKAEVNIIQLERRINKLEEQNDQLKQTTIHLSLYEQLRRQKNSLAQELQQSRKKQSEFEQKIKQLQTKSLQQEEDIKNTQDSNMRFLEQKEIEMRRMNEENNELRHTINSVQQVIENPKPDISGDFHSQEIKIDGFQNQRIKSPQMKKLFESVSSISRQSFKYKKQLQEKNKQISILKQKCQQLSKASEQLKRKHLIVNKKYDQLHQLHSINIKTLQDQEIQIKQKDIKLSDTEIVLKDLRNHMNSISLQLSQKKIQQNNKSSLLVDSMSQSSQLSTSIIYEIDRLKQSLEYKLSQSRSLQNQNTQLKQKYRNSKIEKGKYKDQVEKLSKSLKGLQQKNKFLQEELFKVKKSLDSLKI